jgi:hypothetical protein
MIELRRHQFAAVLGMTIDVFDRRAADGHIVLAWGASVGMNAKYYAVDLPVVRVIEEAAGMTGFADGAAITATHMDHVLETIGRAEHDRGNTYYLAIATGGHGAQKEFLITSGLPGEILQDINGSGFRHTKVITINITKIIADLRQRGAKLGLDLSAPFFLPPTHEQFAELIGEAAELRRAALAALKRADPKRYAKKCKREPLGRAL